MANALIPLGVNMPDLAGAYAQGQQGYQNQQEIGRQNALRAAMAQHGPAAMRGDVNAQNALAAVDTELGMNLMGKQQDMELANRQDARLDQGLAMDQERLQMARETARQQTAQHTASMAAADRAMAQQEIDEALAAATQVQDEAQWDALMSQKPETKDFVGQFGQRDMLIASALGIKDALAMGAGGEPTDDMREYDFAKTQGYDGSMQDWLLAQKKAGGVNVTTNVGDDTPADAAFYAKIDNAEGDLFSGLLQRAPGIQRNAGTIDILEQQLSNAPTGVEGAWKQFAGEMGLPVEGVSDIQAAQASINAMVPDQRPAGSGTMSDADLALFKESLPRIINQPGGNGLIIGKLRAINEYDREISSIANDLVSRKITREEARKRMASVPNPLQGYAKEVSGLAKSGTIEPSSSDADLFRKYGIE
jgi:flagellar protein FlgJ